jgi:two-component system, response regulator PdtaR
LPKWNHLHGNTFCVVTKLSLQRHNMNTPLPAAKILIVDDAASLRAVLRAFFSSQGYVVVGELASGANLLETVGRLRPDIVCLDYNLPGANGIELLKVLNVDYPNIAVVIITGDATPELESIAVEAGAAGFLRKPFTPNRMEQEMRQIVHAQSLLKRHSAGPSKVAPQTRGTAVVVDDSATMRRLLAAILAEMQVQVVGEASDGKQGVELSCQHEPDLICLDMNMPVMNGLQALEHLRARQVKSKILMISGNSDREMVVQALKDGARGYILKPFEPDKVVAAINNLLAVNHGNAPSPLPTD